MKSQIKRFSKSTLSVILSLCMLVSCMTVGIIATGAAVSDDEAVGYDTFRTYFTPYYSGSDGNGWIKDNKTILARYLPGDNSWQTAEAHDTGRTISGKRVYYVDLENRYGGADNLYFRAGSSISDCDQTSNQIHPFSSWNTSFPNKYYTGSSWTTPSYDTFKLKNNGADLATFTYSSGLQYTATATLTKGTTYKLNVNDGTNYWANGGAGSITSSGSATMYRYGSGGSGDCLTVTPSVTGTYSFTWTLNDKGSREDAGTLAVTYPTTYTVSYTLGTHVNKSSVSGGDDNGSGTITAASGSNVAITVTYDTNYTYDSTNSSLGGATASNSNKTFTFSSISSNKTISIAAKSSLTALSAPATVTLNGSAANCSVSTTTVGAKIRLAWSSVTNAGSYKVYKGNTLVTTVTTLYYDIERAASYSGAYSVVAVPSNTSSYSESAKSTARTLTVSKSRLNTPTLSVTPTAIANGDSVSLTLTDTNTSFTAAQFTYYYYTGSYVTLSNDYIMTPGVAKTLYPTSNTTYMACAYPLNGENNDYYLQSYSASSSQVSVYSPGWYLVGDLVDSTNNKWNNQTTYPVDTYVSANVFKRTVTYENGGTNDKHYFRVYNGSNQYTVTSGTDTDMSTHNTSGTAVTAGTSTTNGAMYVTGQGTFNVYVDQSGSSPKVWVVKTALQTYTTTVYVNQDSGATNLYAWKDDNNEVSAWPGELITGTTETVNDIPYYKYIFEGYWDHINMVPNKSNGSVKTADITNVAANATYYITWDGSNGTTASISTTAPVIQLGYKVQNTSSASHVDFSSRSVSVTLGANTTYEFWMKSANTHYNDQGSGTMTRANCTNWTFNTNTTNTKIQTDLAGTYTFTYTVSGSNFVMSVTYPPEPKYTVTINQGDHGTLTVDGNSFTTGGTVQIGSLTTATVQANAASGYHFTGWTTTGGVSAASGYSTSSNPIVINASATGTLTATYAENSYTLTLQSQNTSYGTITAPASTTMTVHPFTATSLSGVTVAPANGYKFNGWKAGTGVTLSGQSSTTPSSGTVKASQDSTLTAKFTKVSYSLTGKTSLNGTVGNYGTVKFYSNSGCTNEITTSQIGNTVYAKFTSSTHTLVNFTLDGTGTSNPTTNGNVFSFKMGYSNVILTANVSPQSSVTYYVDMHNNDMSGKTVKVSVVNSSGAVVKDGNGNNCEANLAKQGNSTVYAASINTPLTPSGSGYSALKFKVTYNGTAYPKELASNQVSVLYGMTNKEIWLEAVNESSQTLSIQYSTAFVPASGSTPAVAEGNRRIYLAKPYEWQTTDNDWENIGVYHWGDYSDILWNNGVHMNYLGYGKMPGAEASSTDKYHFYYVDLPKAINGNKVQNIIFQGWGTNTTAGDYTKAQTGNIEEIPDSANFFVLSKDGNAYSGTMAEENVKIPTFARHAATVAMNVGESGVSIAPNYTGAKVTYTSGNTSKVTVSSTGVITPVASTITNGTDTPVTITVKVYGTIGEQIRTEGGTVLNGGDAVSYTVRVSVHNPSNFNGFNIMSIESDTYTVSIPNVGSDQPGYFDMSNEDMEFTVTGLLGVSSSKTSAVITPSSATNPNSFTVKYAKKNTRFSGYNDIEIVGKIVTKSITHTTTGNRYGIKNWLLANNTDPEYTISKVINNGTETATTIGVNFTGASSSTFRAVFESYVYVDVNFTFNYYEYKPEVDADGMINYPYDATWADEDNENNKFAASHELKTYTVSNYEVRNKTAANITTADLATAAATAIGVMPSNNYYTYTITAAKTTKEEITGDNFTVNSTVNMTQNVRHYSVYLNGSIFGTANSYTYQQYVEPTVNTASKWYAVESAADTNTANAPLLATGTGYKFRVKGDTFLRTVTGTSGVDPLRSEVDFSHYEVIHRDNPKTEQEELVEYLLQNFYIADFFSPANVLDPSSNNGQGNLPYDDAQFVGGGVVYYSMNGVTENSQGTPFANAVSAGYVDGSTGKINEDAVKEMLKTNIEAQYAEDNIAGTAGEETAMKVAYGTEIEATKNVEGGFNTGIIYRYLPLNQYKRNNSGAIKKYSKNEQGEYVEDENGEYVYEVNTNTFRYSNTLQSYQYVYASGNENKSTNAGKNMRLYSYYVYSYTAYNQETNVPETKYEIVISDNYSDASTYWNGN